MSRAPETTEEHNVAVAKRLMDAFNAGDLDASLALLKEEAHPDFVWKPAIAILDGGEYRGADGMRAYDEDFRASFQAQSFEPEFSRAIGTDTVLILGRLHGTGQQSGASVSGERGIVLRFRERKLASMASYPSHAEAIRVAEEETAA